MSDTRTFEFTVPDERSADALMDQARSKARDVGIVIRGDGAGGDFQGAAQGRYVVAGRTVTVEVEKKPAFVPWKLIESGLRKMFG